MKKLIALLLALACIMMLAACNAKNNNDAADNLPVSGGSQEQSDDALAPTGEQGLSGGAVSSGTADLNKSEDDTVIKFETDEGGNIIKVEPNKNGDTSQKAETPPDSATSDLVISFDELINAGNK